MFKKDRHKTLQVMAWGTYDRSKPRVRILLRALEKDGLALTTCHVDVWNSVADKSQIRGLVTRLHFLLRWICAYPSLIWRFVRSPKPDVMFVGYLGQLDVLILWPFAKIRGVPVVWDAFISLYNTIVEDRRLISPKNPLARLLHFLEWMATRSADCILLDTQAHADYFADQFRVPADKTATVFVGAETEIFFNRRTPPSSKTPFTVLFYGQFIPLR